MIFKNGAYTYHQRITEQNNKDINVEIADTFLEVNTMIPKEIKCLMLEKCNNATKINCTDRDFETCDLFKNLISEANRTILTKQELKNKIVLYHCFTCNTIRKFKTVEESKNFTVAKTYVCSVCGRIEKPKKGRFLK